MPRTKDLYFADIKNQLIVLRRNHRSIEGLVHEFEPSVAVICGCINQAERDDCIRDNGLTGAEPEELHPSCLKDK